MTHARTVVFKMGSFSPELSRDDLANAFYTEFKDRYVVKAIQFVPGQVVKVTFDSAKDKKAICSQQVKLIGSVECEVLNFAKRLTFLFRFIITLSRQIMMRCVRFSMLMGRL